MALKKAVIPLTMVMPSTQMVQCTPSWLHMLQQWRTEIRSSPRFRTWNVLLYFLNHLLQWIEWEKFSDYWPAMSVIYEVKKISFTTWCCVLFSHCHQWYHRLRPLLFTCWFRDTFLLVHGSLPEFTSILFWNVSHHFLHGRNPTR